MPSLIQDDAQIRALGEISALLDEVRSLNTIVNSNKAYTFRVSKKQDLVLEDPDLRKRISAILLTKRARYIKEINLKASKFHISLDEDEKKVIADSAISAAASPVDDLAAVEPAE